MVTSSHLTSSYLTSHHTIPPHLTSPHLVSPHITSYYLTSPRLISSHLILTRLTSPHPISPELAQSWPTWPPSAARGSLAARTGPCRSWRRRRSGRGPRSPAGRTTAPSCRPYSIRFGGGWVRCRCRCRWRCRWWWRGGTKKKRLSRRRILVGEQIGRTPNRKGGARKYRSDAS